jgi:small subunit ribosomal protein S18
MNYWNKDKKASGWNAQKKRTNWNQSLKTTKPGKVKKIKKSLQYILLIKKFQNIIDYKNIRLLKAFLTKYGKIRPRRKTRISIQKQHAIARAIRKARSFQLIPYTCDVKI